MCLQKAKNESLSLFLLDDLLLWNHSSLLKGGLLIIHQSFVTTPPPPGSSGDWLFIQKSPAISPTLQRKTFGKTTAEFSLTPNLEDFTPTFCLLTTTFCKVSVEKYSKTPTFSGRQHFYSYFQNPSENSARLFAAAVYCVLPCAAVIPAIFAQKTKPWHSPGTVK